MVYVVVGYTGRIHLCVLMNSFILVFLVCQSIPLRGFGIQRVCVYSSFVIILKRKKKLDALLLLSYICIVTINVLWLFLTVPWVGLQCVIVIFPDHIRFFS